MGIHNHRRCHRIMFFFLIENVFYFTVDLTEVESECRIEGNSNDPIEAMPQQPMRAKTCCAHLSIRDLER
ncbi:hypothetical protein TNCV_4024141 [Trichonephila clavipes]|nr:hypothetical protein TNCV_4024141 [Trichonephila clavipes]